MARTTKAPSAHSAQPHSKKKSKKLEDSSQSRTASPRPEKRLEKRLEKRPTSRPEQRLEKRPEKRLEPRPNRSDKGSNKSLWLFGLHAVSAALDNPLRKILRIIATQEGMNALSASVSTEKLPSVQILDRANLARIIPAGAVHQGVAVQVSPLPAINLEEHLEETLQDQTEALIVILDQVTDPHNVGAIIRSAAAFGAKALITQDRHSPEETGTLAKSASGALERLPILRVVNIVQSLDTLKKAGFWVVGLAGEAPQTLAETKFSGKIAIVLGAEGSGLRRLTREHCDLLARLPITDAVESLNVSNAAAVALYEICRKTP